MNIRLAGRLGLKAAIAAVLAVTAAAGYAQNFSMLMGGANRLGTPTASPAVGGGPAFNNVGRNYLRWWNPIRSNRVTIDTDMAKVAPPTEPLGTAGPASGSWTTPALAGLPSLAFNFSQIDTAAAPYRMTRSVAQSAGSSDPRTGATAVYQWTFTNLTAGAEYQLSLNLPIGPTSVNSLSQNASDFPQRYYVVDVIDGTGTNFEIVDTTAAFGFYALGGGRIFTPAPGNNITVRLYNTTPRNSNGQFLDPAAIPGQEWVYADAAAIENNTVNPGAYTAAPIAYELNGATAPAALSPDRARAMAARNEAMLSGRLGEQRTIGTVSSYNYAGGLAAALQPNRLNVNWSFPVARPADLTATESTRYNTERENWLFGPAAGAERHTARWVQDNGFANTATAGGGFAATADPSLGAFWGPDYLVATALVGSVPGPGVSEVAFNSNLPDGNYTFQVYLPGLAPVSNLGRAVVVHVYQGLTLLDSLRLDQTSGAGWITVPGQPTAGYPNGGAAGELSVRIYDISSNPADAGRRIVADAVRWIAPADLRITSTPAMATSQIALSGGGVANRDVAVVARENGTIAAIDAVGDTAAGTTTTFWTYPTENPVGDPNAAAGQDGRVSEAPTGFGRTSPLIANVGGTDYVFVASTNGRVYSLELQGRGDGSTRRVWSFPNDYDPSNPTAGRALPLAPIEGSLAFGQVAGADAIFVPTAEGALYALSAAGNPATRTTTVLWTAVHGGRILSTPVYRGGFVYYTAETALGANDGAVFCVDATNGNLVWTQVGFAWFGPSSPLFVDAATLVSSVGYGAGPDQGLDTIFVADSAGVVASLDPTTGAIRWQTAEVASGASAGPAFTLMTVARNDGVYVNDVPVLVVPTNGGSVVALLADGNVNVAGTRRVWQYNLETDPDSANSPATPVATGGWLNTGVLPNFSWMYVADAVGNLYAFNGDSDTTLTPGQAPGSQQLAENEPGATDLQNLIDPNKVILLPPDIYEQINTGLTNGTLTNAQITALAGQAAVRRIFEFGETMYVMVYDLADLGGGPVGNYLMEVIVSSPGQQIRRQLPVRDVGPLAPGSKIFIYNYPILPNQQGGANAGTDNLMRFRAIRGGARTIASPEVPLSLRSAPTKPFGNFAVANPLAMFFPVVGTTPGTGVSSVGNSIDATLAINLANGSPNIDATVGLIGGPKKESLVTPNPLPGSYVGPSTPRAGDLVSHGATGAAATRVLDRSLSRLIFGPQRGLPGVRMASEDLSFSVRVPSAASVDANRNIWKPLSDNGLAYPGFEDLPFDERTQGANRSLDYPNMSRAAVTGVKSTFGRVENPFFNQITMTPPTIASTDLTAYRTQAGYEAQLTRTLESTPVELQVNVPRFTPASGPNNAAVANRPGYKGLGYVYLDSNNNGFQPTEINRQFGLGVRVAPDERPFVGTPTVDLGSLPSGGGYNGGNPTGSAPALPFDPASIFRPGNTVVSNMFQSFEVYNEGNVNLLNVRVAKAFDRSNPVGSQRIFRPVELFAPGLHELAWLDGPLNMFSSLDPLYSPTRTSGFDTEGRMILQKSRPGDTVPTRLSVNPIRRANPNLNVPSGSLLAGVPTGDPRVGVAAPIGTPSGDYLRKIFVFEDTLGSNGATPETPSLGPRQTGGLLSNDDLEAYSDPAMTLKFVIREARLTNRATTKAAPNVDNLIVGNEPHVWANSQPTGLRAADGSLFVAFASNRRDAANGPGFAARPKLPADAGNQDSWRIYLSALIGDSPSGALALGQSPMRDFQAWNPAGAAGWFRNQLVLPDPALPATTIFNLPTGFTVDPNSMQFGSPSWPAAGAFNPLSSSTGIKVGQPRRMLAFLGSAQAADGSGSPFTVNQIHLARIVFGDPSTVFSLDTMPYDPFTIKSKPSVAQTSVGARDFASVFYTGYSAGSGQVFFTTFDGARPALSRFGSPRGMGGFRAFERVGPPSVTLRRFKNGFTTGGESLGRLEVSFAAKRRGRANGEAFLGRLAADANGLPTGRDPQLTFGPRLDELMLDTNTGLFWAPGANIRLTPTDLAPTPAVPNDFIDIYRLTPAGYTSILDQTTQAVDLDTGLVTYATTLGGKLTLDGLTGSVRMSGVTLPRGARLFIRYSPYYLAIGSGAGLNYRSAEIAFDDRLIGVSVVPTDPSRNLVGDLNYWFSETGGRPAVDSLIRSDRMIASHTRTASDGSAATRPSMKSFRFGANLPLPIATNPNGTPVSFTVNWTNGPSGAFPGREVTPAAERFYEIDPSRGRIYLLSGGEARRIFVTYTGVDSAGRFVTGVQTEAFIDLIEETPEALIPIEQASNESGISMALDPSNSTFNASDVRRPGLLWLFWTSTRGGGPDVYFQTIAPRFSQRTPAP